MLTSNLWVDVGLVNEAMGTVRAVCYRTGGLPGLPIAVMVHFDSSELATLAPPFPTALYLSLLFVAAGLPLQARRFQLPLNWHGQSPCQG